MKKFTTLIKEENSYKYDYGCVMLDLDIKGWKSIVSDIIKDEDIYDEEGYGIETEPHITLLWGYDDKIKFDEVKKIVENYIRPTIELSTISIFENDDFDVVKFEIKNDLILQMNNDLAKLPHHSTFPDYHPHVTLSYVKKGKGKDYVKELSDVIETKGKEIIFSLATGTTEKEVKTLLKW